MKVSFQTTNFNNFQARTPKVAASINVSKEALIQKIESGYTLPKLAKWLDTTVSRVRALMAYHGIKTKNAQVLEKIKPDELRSLIDAGMTQYEIAQFYKINGLSLTSMLNKLGLVPADRKAFDSVPDEELISLIKNGKTTLKKLSEKYGINYLYVVRRYKNIGVESRYQKTLKLELVEQDLRKMVDSGMNVDQIAYHYNVSPQKIINAFRTFGIERKQPINKIKFDAIFSDPQKIALIEKYASEGKTVTEIANIFKVPMSTLYAKMREHGIKTAKNYRDDLIKNNLPSMEVLRADIKAGSTIEKIAEKYNVPKGRVYECLNENNILNQRAFERSEKLKKLPPKEQIISDILSGLSIEKMASKYGVSNSFLNNWLSEMGLKPRVLRNKHKIK